MKVHLITGATGFVGKYLVNALLEKGECVWIIVRPLDNVSAHTRVERIFHDHRVKFPNTFRVIEGDIMMKGLGIKDSIVSELKNNEVIFWHLAANLSFATENRADVQRTNYIGTTHVVDFVNRVARKFMHMSTAYVCGNSSSFGENELYKGQRFRNYYEKSKFEAEKYVRDNCRLPYLIFRPSIIIGDAYQGKAEGCTFGYYRYTFMFYFLKKQVLKTIEKKNFTSVLFEFFGTRYDAKNEALTTPWLFIPYPRNGQVNMVTVDYVIESMIKLYEKGLHDVAVNLTHNKPPAHRFILNSIMHDIGFRGIKLIPVPPRIFGILAKVFYFLAIPVRKYIKSVMWYIPYITTTCRFERSVVENHLGNPPEISRTIIERINTYAKENILEHIEV
jgi:nucleoside-diphosphate-sugar epimerase